MALGLGQADTSVSGVGESPPGHTLSQVSDLKQILFGTEDAFSSLHGGWVIEPAPIDRRIVMNQEHLDSSLKEIRHLLSHLHGEITGLEAGYREVLLVLKKMEKCGAAQASCDLDDLTGLLRRNAYFRKWEELLEKCQELGENCGVLMLDIDHFKRMNDTHGHATGDEVLKRVSELFKKFESPRCFTGRLGGEEFAVALSGTDAEILGLAEMIRRGVERLHGAVIGEDGRPSTRLKWRCTISAGMASSKSAGYDPARLLKAADEALYLAKRKGRNQVRAA